MKHRGLPLPRKFDDPVEERGNSFSTGQKQLINFARALAYNPRILILDEATSSVDTDTELRIRGALERMVAHLHPEGRMVLLEAAPVHSTGRCNSSVFTARERGAYLELFAQCGLKVRSISGVDPAPFRPWLLPHLVRLPRPLR